MGKKKSVVLMIMLTIVIAVLCFITAFPSFVIPGTAKKWNPAVMQYDLGTDLGGGYYVYYYPQGVITETEYESNLASFVEAVEKAEEGDDKVKAEDAKNEYENSYKQVAGSNLYFSTDAEADIVVLDENNQYKITDSFKEAFNAAAEEIKARYEAKSYSDYRVAVVDGYAIRIELPVSEEASKAEAVISSFAKMDEMTMKKGGEVLEELQAEGATISDLIKKVSVKTMNVGKVAYMDIQFTKAGKAMLKDVKSELSTSDVTDTSSAVTLDIMLGEETFATIYQDNIMENNTVRIFPVDGINKDYVRTLEIIMESAMESGDLDMTFELSEVRVFDAPYGENTLKLVYIAIAVALLAVIVASIVKMGRFGGVSAYATLSYFVVIGLCLAFITAGTFEVTLGTVLVFLVGLALVNVMQYHIYQAIKAEFNAGKTVESSVKGGYRKTLGAVIDVYAVALIAALTMLIGSAGLSTLAVQAVICVVTAAFMNLLWARAINFIYLSASKNKYKYFRFVREDDEDDE